MGCLGPRAPTIQKKGRKEDAARKSTNRPNGRKRKRDKKERGVEMPALMAPTTPREGKEKEKRE